MRLRVDEDGELILSEVYLGIGIETDRGLYGICQRDDAIEIRLPNGKWLNSDDVKRLEAEHE